MANNLISPENLATKAFLITFVGAIVYFTTVFVFVINGDLNGDEQASDQVEDLHD